MNLVAKKARRRSLREGDIFAGEMRDGTLVFGRIIDLGAKIGPMHNCVLVYIYADVTKERGARPALSSARLLVPPLMTNKLPWTQGYFDVVEHRLLGPDDKLTAHCFYDHNRRRFMNESNEVVERTEPVGEWALFSYRTIDDAISAALGIPLAGD